MNNIFTQIKTFTSENGVLLIGEIPPLEILEAAAGTDDRMAVESFTSPSRRAERLAWRLMLKVWARHNRAWQGRELEVEYSPQGAPKIKNFPYNHISVSHCRDRVAIALSMRPCAVDIESLDRNFERLAARYMSIEELATFTEKEMMASVWCAKEVLYKLSGIKGLDLRHDIRISALDISEGIVEGEVRHSKGVVMRIIQLEDGDMVVYRI